MVNATELRKRLSRSSAEAQTAHLQEMSGTP